MTEAEKWILGCTIVMALATVAAVIISLVALNKKTDTQISPQPLLVEITKALHERFADKGSFEQHVAGNTARHAQLFNRIDEVEQVARKEIAQARDSINADRARTMEKLNEQFTFIRENIAAINAELKIRSNCSECSNFQSR